MKRERRPLTETEKDMIIRMAEKGTDTIQIAREMGINGTIVNGVVVTARNMGRITSQSNQPYPINKASEEERFRMLEKAHRESKPEVEFNIHIPNGQIFYIAAYKEGVIIKIGESDKEAILTPFMAVRISEKIKEMANWVRM